MKTRTIALILAVCGCLTARGLNVYADDGKTTPTAVAAPATTATEADKLKELENLAALGPKAADKTKDIEGLLKDPSPKVRCHAALALGAIGPAAKDSATALAELLKDPEIAVRRSALRAIKEIHPGPQAMIPILTKMLQDSDPTLTGRVLNAIADAGPEAVPGLKAALKDEKARYWALVILRDIGPAAKDAMPEIVETLNDKRPEIRREAVLTLGAMGETAKSAAPELVKLLKDDNTDVAATFVLGELGEIPKDAEDTIKANAKSDNVLLSTTSLWALCRVHPDDKDCRRETTEKLIARLKDKDGFVRAAAARALASLPPAPEITAPIWEKAMKDADETTIRHALDALAALGPQAVPRLIEGLKYEKFRPEIIYTLGRIGPDAAPATDELAKLVEDKNSRVAHEAIIALGHIGPSAKAAVPALVKSLDQPMDKDMNFTAIEYALSKIGPDAAEAESMLMNKLQNKDDNVRLMAGWALSQIHGASADAAAKAVPVLIAGLSLSDVADRVLAAKALGSFGPLAKDATDALKKAAADADKNVADEATTALQLVEKAAPPAGEKPAAVSYVPGDQVVTVEDKIEIGVRDKPGQIVPKGTHLKVLEIRGSWIGVQAEIDGKPHKGWVLGDQIGKP